MYTAISGTFLNYFTAWPISSSNDIVFTVRSDSPNLSSTRFAIFTSNIGGGASNGREVYITISAPVANVVTFNANGGTGTMANQSSSAAAALNANSYSRSGYNFTGWNTAANGTGTAYAAGASFPFSANTTLYAQWAVSAKTVTFDANGGTGSMSNQASSAPANLTANTFTNAGQTFTGWNTLANGTGIAFADASSYGFVADVTLYAQWAAAAPVTPVYNGPIVEKILPKQIDAANSRLVTLTGSNLPLNCTITVGGQVVKPITSSSSVLTFEVPTGLSGYQALTIVSGDKAYRFDGRVFIASAQAIAPASTSVSAKVSGFAAGSSTLNDSMKKKLDSVIAGLAKGSTISCVGYASGPQNLATDTALAKLRAVSVCGYLKKNAVGVTVASSAGAFDQRSGAAVRRVEIRFNK